MIEDVKTIILKEGDMYILEGPKESMYIGIVHGKIHYRLSKMDNR